MIFLRISVGFKGLFAFILCVVYIESNTIYLYISFLGGYIMNMNFKKIAYLTLWMVGSLLFQPAIFGATSSPCRQWPAAPPTSGCNGCNPLLSTEKEPDMIKKSLATAALLLAGKILNPWQQAMGLWNSYRRLAHSRDEYDALMAAKEEF